MKLLIFSVLLSLNLYARENSYVVGETLNPTMEEIYSKLAPLATSEVGECDGYSYKLKMGAPGADKFVAYNLVGSFAIQVDQEHYMFGAFRGYEIDKERAVQQMAGLLKQNSSNATSEITSKVDALLALTQDMPNMEIMGGVAVYNQPTGRDTLKVFVVIDHAAGELIVLGNGNCRSDKNYKLQ